jgi:pimeloyl-ACP methyl ester carboxylesterase
VGEIVMGFTTKWLLARTLRRGAASQSVWPRARIDGVWKQFDQGTQRATLRLHRLASPLDGLEDVGAPIVIFWGERDPWLSVAAAERLPHVALTRIRDAGHWPWLDDPAVLDRAASALAALT